MNLHAVDTRWISSLGGPKILEYGHAIKLYTMHECWLIWATHVLFRFNTAHLHNLLALVKDIAANRSRRVAL